MNKVLALLFLLFFIRYTNAQAPANGLAAYYPFNGNANDESGNGNNGVINGALLSTDRFGNPASAYYFDGNSTISASDNNLPAGSSSRTISMWVYADIAQNNKDAGNDAQLLKYGTPATTVSEEHRQVHIAMWGNDLTVSSYSSLPHNDYSFSHPVKQWFQLTVVLGTQNQVSVYINGVYAFSYANEVFNTVLSGSLILGEFFNQGKLDDIRIYNRALCDVEIKELYTAEAPPANLATGLVAYYPFNGNANDESGNGHDGVVSGATSTADRFGNAGKAYRFDGSNSIRIPQSSQFEFSDFSISSWFYLPTNQSGSTSIIANPANAPTEDAWIFALNPDNTIVGYTYPGNALNGGAVSLNQWHHGVFIKSGTTYSVYVDGVLRSSQQGPSSVSYNFPRGIIIGADDDAAEDGIADNLFINATLDDIRIYNRALGNIEIDSLYGSYQTYSCVNWNGIVPALDPESASAFDYLCSNNIIQKLQQPSAVNDTIRKDELAKIIYRGLYAPNPDAESPVAGVPNPFLDLQPGISAYVKEAKALSYLEYGDGISVFKRSFTHFKPRYALERKYVIKAMLEAFNIKPYTPANAPAPSCWYSDVQPGDEMYYYILKARDMGFVKAQTSFNPDRPISRKEAFLILYRILKYFETNSRPVPTVADYFIPGNMNPCNMGRTVGLSDGNFNSYTKTSFGIAGLMPLAFAHSYNSLYTELPDSGFHLIEPLGRGWTHNYNCYLQKIEDVADTVMRAVITWGDGTINTFTEKAGLFTACTAGVYATLTADNGQNHFTYTTKSKVSYVFTRNILITGSVWVLSSVTDRNGNALTLTWTPYPVTGPFTAIRLFKVADPAGRYLQFGYDGAHPSSITSVTAVTGTLTRMVYYTYENNFTDLQSYVNLKGDTTKYIYEDAKDPTRDHLLKQIVLPKGNVIDNTYENRKVKSSQLAGQYITSVNTGFNYTADNNTNFTDAHISTTRNGVTLASRVQQDQLGNVKRATNPTGDLGLEYADPSHPTKPSSFSNNINHLSADTKYDAVGNVTSVTKFGAALALKDSFTYNAFNDIETYTNPKGNKTLFAYNNTGNLVKITDALGNETNMQVNADGTVQKVTNPENIFTDFGYDIYGNTTQTSLQNTITSNAVYDAASRLVEKRDPNGVSTTIEYEVNDLVKKVIADYGGLNNTVQYNYDKNDNLDTIVNPKGGKTALTYNNYDQLVKYSFAGFNKNYTYNEDGTVNTFTNQNGHSFNYVYNSDGTLQSDGYASYAYDAEFNLLSITSTGNGKQLSFGYDALKRTTSVGYNDFTANHVLYEYDNNNNVTAITYPGGFKVGYAYDALDRLVRVYNVASNANYAQYTYLKDGRLSTQVNGNGTKTIYGYDGVGRLNSIANQTSANANIGSYGFGMDNAGNHTSETAQEPYAPAMPVIPTESIAYTHDDANRMNNRSNTSFTYDNNGNNSNAAGQWNSTYTYDVKDNLLTSTAPVLNCEYDGLENRRRKNDTLFVVNILGSNSILMETDLAGLPRAYYIHGLGLICRLDATQANPAYYHYDYRGSTTVITNSAEVITHSYRYGAFGEMMAATENGFRNTYRYVGKYGVQFEDSSLYFMRARYYNPMKGRFLGEDPVSGTNLYNYTANNPINAIDINGMASLSDAKDVFEFLVELNDKGEATGVKVIDGTSVLTSLTLQQAAQDGLVSKVGSKYIPISTMTFFAKSFFLNGAKGPSTADDFAEGFKAIAIDAATMLNVPEAELVVSAGISVVGLFFDTGEMAIANAYLEKNKDKNLTDYAKEKLAKWNKTALKREIARQANVGTGSNVGSNIIQKCIICTGTSAKNGGSAW